MRVLSADYVEDEKLLAFSIADIRNGALSYIETDCLKNIKSKKQAMIRLKRIYEEYNCDKIIVEDDLIE